MRYLVDGYNVIFSTDLKNAGLNDAIEKLTSLVQGLSGQVILVFDGREGIDAPHKPWVYFTKGVSADEFIVKKVREFQDPHSVKVVTRDRQIISRVKSLGAKVVDPQDFLKELKTLRRKNLYVKGVITKEDARKITEELKKLWLDEE